MDSAESLILLNSWPIWEQHRQFELGHVLNSVLTDLLAPTHIGDLGPYHAGCWECDLADNSLIWSGGVYDIFGLPRNTAVRRDEAASLYCEESRTKMERLRSHALRHRRGFTLDAEICSAIGEKRWMRLIAVPVFINDRVVRLHGLKIAI